MKKLKFLPSVLMLVLSVAVLSLGVYAANPSTNTVTGSIKVNASSYPIAIRCLLDGEEIEKYDTIRAGITWTDGLSNLEFNTDTALTVEDVDDRVITLEVTNLSNINLGAYFLTNDDTLTAENKATLDSISTVEHLVSGTDTVVKATKTGYQKLEPNVPVEMTVTMSLYQIFYEELDPVGFSFVLNVEEYQETLAEMEQGVTVNTNNNPNVTVSPTVMHGYTNENLNAEGQEKAEADKMVAKVNAGRYSTTNLAIDDEKYAKTNIGDTINRYRTTNVKFTIYNGEDYGITADINAVLDEANVQVTTLGNAYIGAKKTGEVSLQFTPLRDSNVTVSAVISDVVSKIDIYKATNEVAAEADVYSRIKYNADGYNGGTMKHYIEYGVNPFNPSQKLKWYVWGVKVGESALRAITDDDMDANNKLIKSTPESTREYYFIAENVLDISADKDYGKYLMYNQEYDYESFYSGDNYTYTEGDTTKTTSFYATNYEGSLLQGYLSGTTMRTKQTGVNSGFIATGEAANFYDYYGLTNDPIYNQINARSLKDMCTLQYNNSYNSKYDGMSDKFWALSNSEHSLMQGEYNGDIYLNATAYLLSTGKTGMYGDSWWLRSPSNDFSVYQCHYSGGSSPSTIDVDYICIRPAFKIGI